MIVEIEAHGSWVFLSFDKNKGNWPLQKICSSSFEGRSLLIMNGLDGDPL